MSCANCKQNFPKKSGGYHRYSSNIKCVGSDITVFEALEKVTGVTFEDYTEDEAETETSNENVEEYPVQDEASSSSQKNKEKLTVQNEPGPSNKKKKVKLNAQGKAKQSSPKKPVESVVQNESRRSSRKRHVENLMESESKPSTRKKKVQYSLQSESKSCSQKKQIDSTVQNEKEKRKKPLYFLCNRCYVHLSDCMRHEKAIADFWGRHQEDSYIGERRGVYAAELHYHNDHSYASKKGQLHRHTPPINDLRAPNYEAKRPKYTGSITKNHLNNRSKNPWQIRVNKNNKWDTLVTAIRARQYRRAAKKFYSATKGSRKGFLTVAGIIARREIRKLFEEETKFSLCSVTDFPNTKDFWDKTLDQLKTEAPLLYTVLCSSVTSRKTEATLLRGSTCLKPQLGVTLTCLMHTRAPRKLNSIAKYLCINFWRKRLRGELERKTVAGNHSLCDVYPRQEIVKISKDFQRAEKITQKHLEEEVIDNRRCIENEAAMEVEDFDFDNEDVVRYHKMAALTEVSSNKMFNGLQKVFSHESKECKCTMKFGVYLPPHAEDKKCPVLYWLSGLTCTEQNFVTKAGAQRVAAEKGIIIVAPDTSPRGVEIEGQDDSYDFGSGAGFYVDATEEKWKTNYRMYSYITSELPDLINSNFKTNPDKMSIFGHSMGGHGALICAMKNPGKYKSVSAFAPISNPIKAPWGIKAFTGYLGADQSKWQEYDATELVKKYNGPPLNILIDQGKSDNFYVDKQLLPENLVDACKSNNVPVVLRVQEGYDHSYYFIATFVEDHINHHAKYLCQ